MPNPKYKLTTPCPCCNSQVTVESYTDQPPKLEAVPSPVDNSKSVKTSTPPKPTGVAEAMTNIVNSGVNILGSDSFAYADKGWAHDWGNWSKSTGIYETLEQRRSRLLEEKIADLQRTIGRQSESLTSAHEKLKSLEQDLNAATNKLRKIIKLNAKAYNSHLGKGHPQSIISTHKNHERLFAVETTDPDRPPSPPPANPELSNTQHDTIEKLARLVQLAGDYDSIKNFLEGYFIVKENEIKKWRDMMETKAKKLNEITAIVYPVYEQGNPQKLTPSDVYSQIQEIIMRPEPPTVPKGSWAH